jgi:hypothetical protein
MSFKIKELWIVLSKMGTNQYKGLIFGVQNNIIIASDTFIEIFLHTDLLANEKKIAVAYVSPCHYFLCHPQLPLTTMHWIKEFNLNTDTFKMKHKSKQKQHN